MSTQPKIPVINWPATRNLISKFCRCYNLLIHTEKAKRKAIYARKAYDIKLLEKEPELLEKVAKLPLQPQIYIKDSKGNYQLDRYGRKCLVNTLKQSQQDSIKKIYEKFFNIWNRKYRSQKLGMGSFKVTTSHLAERAENCVRTMYTHILRAIDVGLIKHKDHSYDKFNSKQDRTYCLEIFLNTDFILFKYAVAQAWEKFASKVVDKSVVIAENVQNAINDKNATFEQLRDNLVSKFRRT